MDYRSFLDGIKANDTLIYYQPLDSLYQKAIEDLVKETPEPLASE